MRKGMVPEAEAESAKARMLDWKQQLGIFFSERTRHLLEARGAAYDEINATFGLETGLDDLDPLRVRLRAEAVADARKSPEFESLAELFKREEHIPERTVFGRLAGSGRLRGVEIA